MIAVISRGDAMRYSGELRDRLEVLWVGNFDKRLDERVVVRLGRLREEVGDEVREGERQRHERAREHVLGDPLGVGGGEDAALREVRLHVGYT